MFYLIGLVMLAAMLGLAFVQGDKHRAAQDAPIMDQLRQEKATVVAANQRFESDLGKLKTDVSSCNTKVEHLAAQGAVAQSEVAKAISESDARRKNFEKTLNQRLAEAQAPHSTTRTEPQKCASAQDTLNALADEMRGNAPPVAVPPPSMPGLAPAPIPFATVPPPGHSGLPFAVRKPK